MSDFAGEQIEHGDAYVDSQSAEKVRTARGTLAEAGIASPYRSRSAEESLRLFEEMRDGLHPDGSHVLRARIDMQSPNINMRDPAIYRIRNAAHHRTGDKWKIYPMYDWTHGQNDSMEEITHSLCSLEYRNHRPLYDWFHEKLGVFKSRQIEFARLNLTYTVLSKRKLRHLVEQGLVRGWDDPRMPTLRAMRRRGYTAAAILDFNERTGVSKTGVINAGVMAEFALLEACVREDLNQHALRRMAVLHPLKVVIDNYPEGQVEQMEAVNNPEDPSAGTRQAPFSKIIYIEQDDFRETPPPKYYRLYPGNEVRLRNAYLIKCTSVTKDKNGEITEVHAAYDPATRGGDAPDGRKVKSTLHWVSAAHAVPAEIRMYNRLFTKEDPEQGEEGFQHCLNPELCTILTGQVEPLVAEAKAGDRFQFERQGYFCADPDTTLEKPVFNLTVTLRDSWAKIEKKVT